MTITLCLWGRDLSVPLEDKRTLPRFRESLKQWQEISQSYGSPLVLHEKYARHLGLGVHTMPLPVLSEDLKYLKDKGVDGFELPMAYMGRWIKGLNLYVLARLMWDTNADTDAIIDDYFRQYYGAHSEVMREAFDIMERAHGDWRYWGNNFARVGFNSKVPNAFPMEITTHARKIIQGTEKVRKILADCEQVLEAEQVIRERINCFVACVDYWTTEWLGLIALAEGAELVSKVKSADTEERRQELLQEAEKRFLEAEVMNKKRPSLATQTDKLPMYWDVTGHGPDGVFQESQLEEWLNYLSEVEATGK